METAFYLVLSKNYIYVSDVGSNCMIYKCSNNWCHLPINVDAFTTGLEQRGAADNTTTVVMALFFQARGKVFNEN